MCVKASEVLSFSFSAVQNNVSTRLNVIYDVKFVEGFNNFSYFSIKVKIYAAT